MKLDAETRASRHSEANIAEGKIVGYMAGRMEFGPRALGPGASSVIPGA